MTTESRKQFLCAHCGSTDVTRDAEAAWSVKNQQWELSTVQDQAFCNGECGGQTSLTVVDLEG